MAAAIIKHVLIFHNYRRNRCKKTANSPDLNAQQSKEYVTY